MAISSSENCNRDDSFVFPELKGDILVVGDGDFGYSTALAKAVSKAKKLGGSAANVTASSLDTKDKVKKTYSQGKKHLDQLALYPNVRVCHGLDATESSNLFSEGLWDSIVWNFPYPPFTAGASAADGRGLLTLFLSNVQMSLKPNASIYITLLSKQATNDSWGVYRIANDTGYEVANVMPFFASQIDGYMPRRAYVDESIPNQVADTYMLCSICSKSDFLVSNISKLLKEVGGEMDISQSKLKYKVKFGALSTGRKLRKFLEELSCNADFRIQQRGSSVWIIDDSLTNDIWKLLEAHDGEIPLCTFKGIYQEQFGKPFPNERPLKKQLEIVAAKDKRFEVQLKGRSSWWLIRTKYEHDAVEENIIELLQANSGKIRLCHFRDLYLERFDTPFPIETKHLKKVIEKLLGYSTRFEFTLEGQSDWWLVESESFRS